MPPETHLPPDLRGPTTTLTRIPVGLSGATVYRVDTPDPDRTFVLKISPPTETPADFHRTLHLQRLAAEAGLTPPILHVDEPGRAVLTAFVPDRSVLAHYFDPRTRESTLVQLATTVRRIHALPVPPGAPETDPCEFLAQLRQGLTGVPLPRFADDAIARVLDEDQPTRERAPVLSHNDLNPTNLLHDGETILVLDWAAAGPMDAFYDLAVLALFLRMDEGACLRLLAAYDGRPFAGVPGRFVYLRRLAAAVCGALQLQIARRMGHPGATGAEDVHATPSLADFFQGMRAGTWKIGTPEGQWVSGLALLKESLAV